uniref:DUF3741 domain-containing protein n=1 Tax=Nelumbo nucifera TaxID=4432 RepID=A0A822YSM7_NELNU|nr:TPA_asm: hypothetical protein HUJ06_006167 [Nelumbo nucifera]
MNKKFLRKQNCGIPKSSVLLKSRRNVVDQSPLLSIINLNQKLLRRLKSPGSYCFFFSVTSLTKNFIEKSKTIKMPQNRARSVGYRSFLICNDPSGVVECRTVRTKNVIRKMEPSSDCRRFQKEQSNPSVCREERKRLVSKGNKEELHALPSSQLLEVSRGAQKINHMIDSWSRGLSFDGQSKDITRDLLKGALDLQESLIVLGKLQEASKYMAQLKKKQKPRSDQEGEMDIDRVDSGRFGDKDYQTRLQMSRLSVDDSSRECREELKKMIGDGIYRENLLSISKEEKTSCSGRKFGSTVDIPSTSSSQSVMVHSSRSTSAYCSPTQDKKAKSPNLIAKLMGLEELPPEQVQPSEKQVESEKSSNQQRHIFSTDMPKVRKTKSVDLSANPENRILNKIIEAMQFKEHLKNNCSEGYTHRSHLPNTSCSEQRFDYQIPPIVIIKPLHFPYAKTEGSLLGRFSDEEGAFDTKEILTKLEVKEEPSPKMIIREERAPGFKEMLGRLKVKKELPAEIVIGEEEILDQTQMLRKLEADEEAPTKRTIWEEGAKDPEISPKEPQEVKELKTKKPREPKVKVFKNKEKASPNKRKSYASLNQKPENKESTNQNAERTKMVPPDKRKPIEKDNVTSVAGKRYQNRAKSTSAKLIKPEIELIITKKQVFQQSTVQDPKSVNTTKPVLQNSTDQRKKNHRKKAIPVKDPTVNNSVMEGLKCKDCILTTTLADQVLAGEGRKGFEIEIEGKSFLSDSIGEQC